MTRSGDWVGWALRRDDEALAAIARHANGDARVGLNLPGARGDARPPDRTVEVGWTVRCSPRPLQKRSLLYDKSGEEHFNLISALHKSLRNSDPDAGVYWLARMLEAGEDPLYIARRLIRFASERCGKRRPRGAYRRGCGKGRRALHRHAGREHRARAGGHVSSHRTEKQCRVRRLQPGGGRCAEGLSRSRCPCISGMRRRG